MIRVGVLLLLVGLGALAAAQPGAAQLAGVEVVGVDFSGNETFPDDSLARAIVTRATECRSRFFILVPLCPLGVDFALDRSELRERDLPRDRARLVLWYRQRGFRDVQVDTPTVNRTVRGARVRFDVVEGPPVLTDRLVFTGADGLDGLLDDLPIREGDRLSTIALDAARDAIVTRLANQGFAYAEVYRVVFRPDDDPYRAEVTFDIVPGPRSTYGDITVEGNENLGVRTVLRTTQISTGDLYRLNDIAEATNRLYGLQIVRSASVVPDTLSEVQDSVIDVAITIAEGDPYRVRAGGGWSTAECFNFEARWTSRNFLGGGRLLQLRGRLGNVLARQVPDFCTQSGTDDFAKLTGLTSVDFVQPWIFSTRNSLTASLFAERQSLPDIFIRNAFGAQLALSRTIAPQTVLTGSYRPEVSRFEEADDVLFCTGFVVCDPDDVKRLAGTNVLAPVGLSLTRDRSDDLLNPRRGYRVFVDYEHAASGTGSDFTYDRAVVEASRYVPLGRVVFAARIRGGWVSAGGFEGIFSTTPSVEFIPPQKRFYTGGANSVRGFAQSGLGPRLLVATPSVLLSRNDTGGFCREEEVADQSCVPSPGTAVSPRPTGGTRVLEANAELRFPVGSFFEGVVFGDVGQAWGRGRGVNLNDLELSPGLGVRFPSPVGPIRVDLAYRFRGAEDLVVVTEQIVPETVDAFKIEIINARGERQKVDWRSNGDLVPLLSPFNFGRNDRGLQLHVSIGQAF